MSGPLSLATTHEYATWYKRWSHVGEIATPVKAQGGIHVR